MSRLFARLAAIVLPVLLLTGCGDPEPEPAPAPEPPAETATAPASPSAATSIQPTEGNTATGTVRFIAEENGIRVEASLTGVPEGRHGFHIHENGDCGENGQAAGGHFNPSGMNHGGPDGIPRHVGDFGNITADAEGNATYNRVDALASFDGENNILGKAVIIHADPDDLTSQPTGAAGARIACGIIVADN